MILELCTFFEISSPLLQYEKNVASQAGEDGIIERIMEVIAPNRRFCVEFGAWDGKFYSNCFNLLTNKDWSGVMIEGNQDKYRDLVVTYAGNDRVKTVNQFVDFEGAEALDLLLDKVDAPVDFGLLSIDVDGCDYYIWESLLRYSPEVVVIEFNPTVPNDVLFVQTRSFEVNEGCSLLALIVLGRQKGYELAACTSYNAIFVRVDKYPLLGIASNFISKLYRPLQNGRIFQGYDGTIHVVGMDKLLWNGKPLSSENFQVLPKELRVFGDAQRKSADPKPPTGEA